MYIGILIFAIIGALVSTSRTYAQESDSTSSVRSLTLDEVIRRVMDYNESVQIRILDAEASRKQAEGEWGIFEPQIVGSVERVDSNRPNNTQQLLSLGFSATPTLIERNTIYNGGLEFLAPSGARIRTGYTLRQLDNNLQRTSDREYETFLGASVVQPILKNAGPAVTMARIRLAALASDIAFQEYRRQLMLILSQAEAAYWDLYLSQEQERISKDSLGIAEKILQDNKARLEVGRNSALEVLQSEAGVSLRQARQKETGLRLYEGANRLTALYSDVLVDTNANTNLRAADRPAIREVNLSHFDNYHFAFNLNPDYQIRLKQAEQENIRVVYAKNQRLPQVDLRGSYGLNGLGTAPASSWDNVERAEHPAWSVGVEMRIPITGGIKERKDLEAAKLNKKKALVSLKEAEVQIANSLDSAIHRVQIHRENVKSYESVVDFHEKLLTTQLDRLNVGAIDSKTVLETEEKLFEAKMAVVESLVLFRKALLELELVRGTTLQDRGFDITKTQLKKKTAGLLQRHEWSDAELESLQLRSVRSLDPEEVNHDKALETLRRTIDELKTETDTTPAP